MFSDILTSHIMLMMKQDSRIVYQEYNLKEYCKRFRISLIRIKFYHDDKEYVNRNDSQYT